VISYSLGELYASGLVYYLMLSLYVKRISQPYQI